MRIINLDREQKRLEFARKAAAWFAANPHGWTYTEDDISVSLLLALRWGGGNDCVAVVPLDETGDRVIYEELVREFQAVQEPEPTPPPTPPSKKSPLSNCVYKLEDRVYFVDPEGTLSGPGNVAAMREGSDTVRVELDSDHSVGTDRRNLRPLMPYRTEKQKATLLRELRRQSGRFLDTPLMQEIVATLMDDIEKGPNAWAFAPEMAIEHKYRNSRLVHTLRKEMPRMHLDYGEPVRAQEGEYILYSDLARVLNDYDDALAKAHNDTED